ncbi:MAG: DUF86 domain-containing protein [Bacteroidetes bacterium]|nr:DUF86 domain-containing protein [Bacteroidota bacterium]
MNTKSQLPPLDREKILDRLSDIEIAINELNRFTAISCVEFQKSKDNYAIAAYWLRLAIEAILTVGTHILSRLPSNGKKKDYTKIIFSLGDYNVIPKEFAQKIKGMAGYRNRLVHLYWQVIPEELLGIIKENLGDFMDFNDHIKNYLLGIK